MNKKSAYSSITVILMLAIVIAVGLSFILITGNDYNLADKKSEWTGRYYKIEGEIMEDIAIINDALSKNASSFKDDIELAGLIKSLDSDLNASPEYKLEFTAEAGRVNLILTEIAEKTPISISVKLEMERENGLKIKNYKLYTQVPEYNSEY